MLKNNVVMWVIDWGCAKWCVVVVRSIFVQSGRVAQTSMFESSFHLCSHEWLYEGLWQQLGGERWGRCVVVRIAF